MKVPEQFMQNMQTLLGDGYSSYEASFSMPNYRGLRVNTLREQAADHILKTGLTGEAIPFVQNGYYIHDDASPAKHPFHAAGLYYLQEPSAMLPADRLPVKPGDLVLDLCWCRLAFTACSGCVSGNGRYAADTDACHFLW